MKLLSNKPFRRVRDHDIEEMEIGHTIGNRKHFIEKKRDKDGIIRSQQRFVNIDEGDSYFFYYLVYQFSRCRGL